MDVLGFSYGAHLAIAYTLEHPMAVRKLILVSPIVARPFGNLNGDLKYSRVETRLTEIKAPILINHGSCDGVIPERHARWLEESLPGAQRLLRPGSGHAPFIDRSQRFTERVARFLAEPDSPPTAY